MRESRTYGSVRGALSNERPYRVANNRYSICCGCSQPVLTRTGHGLPEFHQTELMDIDASRRLRHAGLAAGSEGHGASVSDELRRRYGNHQCISVHSGHWRKL
jgi:hypothetical protein